MKNKIPKHTLEDVSVEQSKKCTAYEDGCEEWFMHKVDDLKDGHYEIHVEGLPYKLQMVKEKKE